MTTLKLTSTPAGTVEVVATSNPANIVKIIPVNNMEVVVKAIIADAPTIKVINQTATSDTIKVVPMPGPTGATGATGPTGPAGPGVVAGGTSGQILSKASATDYDTAWIDQLSQENIQDYVAPLFVHNNHTNASVTYEDALNEIHIDVINAPSAGYTSTVKHQVKLAVAGTKGQAVYMSSASGTNIVVSLASNDGESTSSKTMGLLESSGSANALVNVVSEGLLAGLNTVGAQAGDPVWLGINGNLIYGLANKPYGTAHLVFIGIVTRVNANNGEIFVKIQNGFEINELHQVAINGGYGSSPADKDVLAYESSTSLWKNKSFATLGLATTSYVDTSISNLIDAAPVALDTLNELAAALGDDANFATTVTNSLSDKASLTNNNTFAGIQTYNGFTQTYNNSVINGRVTIGEASLVAGRQFSITNSVASNQVLVLKAAASQTANFQEWQMSDGSVRSAMSAFGNLLIRTTGGFGGSLEVGTFSTTTKGIVVRGIVSQTANLTEWQDSAGTVLAAVSASGGITTNGRLFVGGDATAKANIFTSSNTQIGLAIRGVSGQTANLLELQDSAGAINALVSSTGSIRTTGHLMVGSNSYVDGILYAGIGSAATKGLIVRGAASQTANLQEWQDSTGTVWSHINAGGFLRVGGDPGGQIGVVATAAANRPMVLRGAVSQTANLTEWQNSAGTVLTSINSAGSLVTPFSFIGPNATAISGVNLGIITATTGTIGVVVRATASQSANLQEWQDSSANILARIGSTGAVVSTLGGWFGQSSAFASNNLGVTSTNSTYVPFIAKGAASQSVDLTQWQDSAGNIIARIGNAGAGVFSGVGVFGGQSNTPNAQLYVLNGNAANPGLVVRGAASQAGDYTTWQANGGSTIAAITSGSSFYAIGQIRAGGSTSFAQLSSIAASSSTIALGIRGAASQSANLTEWQDSSAVVVAAMGSNGGFSASSVIVNSGNANSFGGTTVSGIILTARTSNAGVIPLGVRGAVSQTASLQEWQNSGGTMLYRIAASGLPYFGSSVLSTLDMYNESASDMAITLPLDDWDDKIRFRYGIYETSVNGVTAWTPATFDHQIVDGRQDTWVNVATASLGHRWTWYGTDLQYMSAKYLRISAGYVNPASTISVLFESSADNITWTSRGSWTGISGYIMKRLFRISDNGADAYVRVTITYTTVQQPVALENIEILTYRPGNQGGVINGSEARLPIAGWNGSRAPIFRSTSPDQISLRVQAPTATASNLTNAVGNGTTITYTTSGVHYLRVGQSVTITGVNPTAYNISGTVATVTLTTFTVTNSAIGTYVSGGTATITNSANMQEWINSSGTLVGSISRSGIPVFTQPTYVNDTASGSVGLQIKRTLLQLGNVTTEVGAIFRGVASQTADLTQWQNSASTALARVSSAGDINAGSNIYANALLGATGSSDVTNTTPLVRIQANSSLGGGWLQATRLTSTPGPFATDTGAIYFRTGTTANTLRIVARAGTANEVTVIDNIPTTTATPVPATASVGSNLFLYQNYI